MYDFSKVSSTVVLSMDWILSRVSDAQIFFYYHGRFKLGVACNSSLRKDNNPSVTFFIGDKGRIVYWDFRDGKGLDCFAYVQARHNCSFRRSLEIIAEDFGLIAKNTLRVPSKLMVEANDLDRAVKRDTLIQFTKKPWSDKTLAFWYLYELEQSDLEVEEVYPVDQLFLNKQEIRTPEGVQRFAKVVRWQEDGVEKVGVKVYSPNDPKMKWLNSVPLHVPFGMTNLSYDSNVVMITKSFKDMMVLKKLFPSVIATQNESEGALPEDVIHHLDEHFDRKVIVFDNDETGVTSSKKFNEKGFDYFNIPNLERIRFGIKDPSDYVKVYGLEELKSLFKSKNLLA